MTEQSKLEEMLLVEMSRRNTDQVADLAIRNPEIFKELFSIFRSNQEPVSRRAAWVIDLITEKHPAWIAPYLAEIIELLPTFRHDGLKRHSLRILARSPMPSEQQLGKLITICFEWLISPKEAIAVKVFCMEILYRLSQNEPDLKQELADSIAWRMEEEHAGFKNRGQKTLRKLFREMDQHRLQCRDGAEER